MQKKGWTGWGDFLGTGKIANQNREFLSFEDARAYARSLGFTQLTQWKAWAKSEARPDNIPSYPSETYAKKGWISYGDFLGSEIVSVQNRIFRPFEEAKTYARSLGFKSQTEWRKWAKTENRPKDIPNGPSATYAKEWKGWGDFLGTGNIANQNREYLSFVEARQFVRSLGIKNTKGWRDWAKSLNRHESIPTTPDRRYAKTGWDGWGDFLGSDYIANQNRKYRLYSKAKSFVHELKLNSQIEFRTWAKSANRPSDIPANPPIVYAGNGWNGWGDFLGTGSIANQNREYRTFLEARAYAQSLGFKNREDWETWRISEKRPSDIPALPREVYPNEWLGWGDFLGTGNLAPKNMKFMSYEDAKRHVRILNFKTRSEWNQWAKSNNRPKNIPRVPERTYADAGWVSYGDFLGAEIVANQDRVYRSFNDARNFAQFLKLKSRSEWQDWAQSSTRPKDIPVSPAHLYKNNGWQGWGDFLGTKTVATKKYVYRSFQEAREYVRLRDLKSRKEWETWRTSKHKPNDIPTMPERVYANSGWNGWGDWLGTGRVANQNKVFLAYDEARDFSRAIGFSNQEQWFIWAKSKERPINIPAYPNQVYAKSGWMGWGDWLGIVNSWNENNIRAFVSSLLLHLNTFSAAGLYVLFQQTGILEITPGSRGQSFVHALKTGRFPKEELEKFVAGERSLVNEFFDDSEMSLEDQEEKSTDDPLISEDKLSIEETLIQGDLPSIDTQGILATLDSKLFSTLDKEAIDFFIKEAVARIWQQAFLDEAKAVEQLELYGDEGTYSQEVKRLFLHDYHGAKSLQIPSGYCFPHQPLLMQLYTAYLIKTRKRLGNWSGTGAGKTLSAILASRVIHAGLTVICCPNSVIGNWKRNILEIYPKSSVFIKETDVKKDMAKKPKYLILNYEFFQQPKAEQKLKTLVDNNIIDFIIIDEIHYSKQREAEKISLRKATISAFLSEASAQNENLHVLGMSATPVINNLFEGKTLIEMVTGVHHDELNTKPTVPNCIAHYQKFVSYGIRWVPKYSFKIREQTERIDCSQFLSEIKHQIAYGSIVDLEAVLTKAKLPFILNSLRSKTIVYTHYVKGILSVLQEVIENKGWRVAIFTGDNKDGLDAFIDGNADVLIASSCVGTGVDRLQHVCNRLIVSSLPWTHAEFEQLKGRIYRQGQIKDHVDVLVPLTYADINGKEWSWCDSRWKRIQFKKSVSDAAVDGVILEGHLRTPGQALQDHRLWLERLERGQIYEIERRKISIPLIGEVKPNVQRRMGDLSKMNSRINHALSSQTHRRFLDHPEEWECYHSVYREDRKKLAYCSL